MHLNLVRSCETPSDPTRCAVPPWVPVADAGRPVTRRGFTVPRGLALLCLAPREPSLFSLCLADCLASYAAFVFRAVPPSVCSMLCSVADSLHLVKPLFHLFNALQCSRFRAACQALRPCAVSVSFRSHRSHRLRLSLLCSAALVLASLAALLSHLVWLWFIAVYFLLVPMRSSVAHLLHLVKHCGSAAALLMLHC